MYTPELISGVPFVIWYCPLDSLSIECLGAILVYRQAGNTQWSTIKKQTQNIS